MADDNDVIKQLMLEESVIKDDIKDMIDENPISDIDESTEDLDSAISKIEDLRTKYRRVHKELLQSLGDEYENSYGKIYETFIDGIKGYIKSAKGAKKNIKIEEVQEKNMKSTMKDRSMMLIIENTKRSINELETEFQHNKDCKVNDDEIIRMKDELPDNLKKLDNISKVYHEILLFASCNADVVNSVDEIKYRYEKLITLKDDFTAMLRHETSSRELEKHKLFKEANLNIQVMILPQMYLPSSLSLKNCI